MNFEWLSEDLSLEDQQLERLTAHLDLLLLALTSLVDISTDTVPQAIQELQLQPESGKRLTSVGEKLDLEQARSLALLICYLARQEQELIRRAVTLLEQVTAQNKAPQRTALLGEYFDKFRGSYQQVVGRTVPSEQLSQLAFKLLIDLLFYSDPSGHRRLWLALLGL